jgi:hypothetical protein
MLKPRLKAWVSVRAKEPSPERAPDLYQKLMTQETSIDTNDAALGTGNF